MHYLFLSSILISCTETEKEIEQKLPEFSSSEMIQPRAPTSEDEVFCVPQAEDFNQDLITFTYAWTDGQGTVLSEESSFVLQADMFDPLDPLSCTVIARNEIGEESEIIDTVTIKNTDPIIESLTITPFEDITVLSELHCAVLGSDPDGDDELSDSYTWSLDGVDIGESSSIQLTPEIAYDGARITCTGRLFDQYEGTVEDSIDIVIGNDTPRIDDISFDEEEVYGYTSISCLVTASDGDDDDISIRYQWKIDDVIQQQNESEFDLADVVSGRFPVGAVLTCTATPFDVIGSGASQSISTTILNEAPVLTDVAITPEDIFANSELLCSGEGSDPDNRPYSMLYSWMHNGVEIGNTSILSLTPSIVSPQDDVSCTITIVDEAGDQVSDVASVVVQETDPVITSVTISPSLEPVLGTELSCTATATDLNNDVTSFSYVWTNESGTEIGTDAILILDVDNSDPEESLTCTAYAEPSSAIVSSTAMVVVGNTPPTLGSAALDFEESYISSTFSCSGSGGVDIDGQELTEEYRWYIGELLQAESSAEFDDLSLSVGDIVRCTVRVSDGMDVSDWQAVETIIQNRSPEIDFVTITPSGLVIADDVLICSYVASDPDGEQLTASYLWSDPSGAQVSTSSILILDPTTNTPTDVFTCSVTVSDPNQGTNTQEQSITISNSTPYFSQPASLESGETTAYIDDVLICSAVAMDLDDGLLAIQYRWEDPDGTLLSTGSSFAVTDENIGELEELSCVAFTADSTGSSLGSSVDITIVNSLPIVSDVTLTPALPISTDSLLCTAGTIVDADSDNVTISYQWLMNSVVQNESSDTLNGPFTVGSEITCIVSPADADGFGDSVEISAVVQNSLPVIDSVTIDPLEVNVNSAVTCLSIVSDIDDETLIISMEWTKEDGSVLSADSQLQLSRSIIGTEELTCTISATDESGALVIDSTSVLLSNTSPEWNADASISKPNGVLANETISCSAEASDVDDGVLDISYSWTNDSGTVLGTDASLVLDPLVTDVGDILTCTATAIDSGSETITSLASEVLINSNPVVVVEILDAIYKAGDSIPCSATGSDADEQVVTFSYEWSVDGAIQTSETASSFQGSFTRGEEVTCAVTPNDGVSDGAAISSSVEVTNTAPVISTLSFANGTLYTNDTATAAATSTDIDGDSITLTYNWYVDGEFVSSEDNTLDGSNLNTFNKDQELYLEVDITDGYDSGISKTSSIITILNTAPVAPTVFISPETPSVFLQDLNCNIDVDATDVDDDVLSYQYFWYRNSDEIFISTLNNAEAEIVAAEEVDESGVWDCKVTVTDEDGASATSTTASIDVEEPGESSDSAALNCAVILASGYFGDSTSYWINPDGGTPFQTMCDFTADGGGWTLAFSAPASDTTYGSAWNYWYEAGETTALDTGVSGKSEAFDRNPFSEIRLTATEGDSEIRAATGTQDNLVSLIGSEPFSCASLVGAGRYNFTSTHRSGSYFPNDYIAIVACDTDGTDTELSTHYDLAVFSTNLNHDDYDNSLGDIGSEDRVGGINGDSSSSSSNIVHVWLR